MARPLWDLATPVALIIFNRPETTKRVFSAIRTARPRQLFVVADGPRPDRPQEAHQCQQARAIIDEIDWDCTVQRNYADTNLGCRERVASGLTWLFQQVDEAIILEDDCLPDPTFFRFCSELLERYRNDIRIAQISGVNFQFDRSRPHHSYYFSRYNHIWGWASWRRAWELHDHNMTDWHSIRSSEQFANLLSGPAERAYWIDALDKICAGQLDTWDCQWTLSCWQHRLLTVIPATNLVSNIGFGPYATHTPIANRYAAMTTQAMNFPLQHPDVVEPDQASDDYTGRTMYRPASFLSRLMGRLRGLA